MSATGYQSLSHVKVAYSVDQKRKEDLICVGHRFENDRQRAMFVALHLGDKELAIEIMKQDMKNTTTRAPGTFPTRIRNRNRAMVQLYEWLVITPFEIKEAYILGDFFPRFIKSRHSGNQAFSIPPTPPARATSVAMENRQPIIYQTILADSSGMYPTKRELRTIIEYAHDLVTGIEYNQSAKKVMYKTQVLAQNVTLATRICAIERIRHAGLTDAAIKKAQQNNTTHLPTRFFSNRQSIENWRLLIRQMENRQARLDEMKWPGQSSIPWCIGATGWTVHPSKRRYQYEAHEVGDLIIATDAVARAAFPTRDLGLKWRCVQEVLRPDTAPMYEHCVSVLGRTYNLDCGLNVMAAGGSNAKAEFIPYNAYSSVLKNAVDHGEMFKQARALKESVEKEAEEIANARILAQKEDELEALVAECAKKQTELERVTKTCNSTSRDFDRKLVGVLHRAQKVPEIVKRTEEDLIAVRRWQLKFANYDTMYPLPPPIDNPQRQRSSTVAPGALDPPLDRPLQRVRSGSHMVDRATSSQRRASSVFRAMQIKREHEEETALESVEEEQPGEDPALRSIKRLAHSLATLPGFSDLRTKNYNRSSQSDSTMADADKPGFFPKYDEISIVSSNRNAFGALTYEVQVVGKPDIHNVSYVALLGSAEYAVADFHHVNPQAPGPWKGFKTPVNWTPPTIHSQGSI